MNFNAMDLIMGLAGGLLIGLSVTIMLIFNGRVTGISGITYRFIVMEKGEWVWRGLFLLGLFAGGFLLANFEPQTLENTTGYSAPRLAVAGFLVGFGTLLGNGCTSGHGVCGISRLSVRSVFATVIFILFGVAATTFMRFFNGELL